jgi:hypothetical protein
VAKVVGFYVVVPPAVVRKLNGRVGALIQYRDKEWIPPAFKRGDNFEQQVPNELIGKLAAFDVLVGNTDRHNKNWLVPVDNSKKGVILIDHGLLFPSDDYYGIRSYFGVRAQREGVKVSDAIGKSWHGKWDKIEAILAKNKIDAVSIRATKERYDKLIKAADSNKDFNDWYI